MPVSTIDNFNGSSLFHRLLSPDMKKCTSASPPPLEKTKPRRHRSRSSPTRVSEHLGLTRTRQPGCGNRSDRMGLGGDKLTRYRSPSVSALHIPIETKSYIKERKSPALKESVDQCIYSFGSGETYFSTRPPLQPLRIVLLGEHPAKISSESRMHRLIENIRRMNDDSGLGNTSGILTEGATIESEYSMLPVHRRSRSGRHLKTPSAKKLQGETCSSSCIVHLLLQQIIRSLPILPSANASDSSGPVPRQSERTSSKRGVNIAMPKVSRSGDVQSRCNIAVQALSQKHSMSEVSNTTAGRNELPDEWVGGVRALRDSHVRLVLRQLRHIDRLNRAIDRAGGSSVRVKRITYT